MSSVDLDMLIKRHSNAKKSFFEYRSILDESYKYALPDKGYFNTLSSGKRNVEIYDSTAILGLGTYADKLQQNMVPPWREWFKLVPGSEIPEDFHKDIQPKLDEISKIIYDHVNHSNFNTIINEAFQDVGISTGIITCEEGDGIESSLMFKSVGVEDVSLECSQNGIIDNVYRTFRIKIRDIESTINGAKLTATLLKKLSEDDNAEVELIECVVKNDNKKFDHVVYYESEKEIVMHSEDDTNPFIVFRERVTSKGVYGMGRIIQLLKDIKVLNKIAEMELRNAGLAISGVYTANDDGVLNPYNVKLVPGTVIPVASNSNTNPSLRPLERSGDFQISTLKIDQKQELIQKVLFGVALGSITKTPVRTATEIDARSSENFEMTSSAFSRFQTELLEKLIKRMVDVLKKAGKIQPIVVDGKEITIKFTSPLAKQQDRLDVGNITEYAQVMAMTGIPPQEISRHVKFEDVPRYIAENMGIPGKLLRTTQEVEFQTIQQAQAQQLQAEQELENESSR